MEDQIHKASVILHHNEIKMELVQFEVKLRI